MSSPLCRMPAARALPNVIFSSFKKIVYAQQIKTCLYLHKINISYRKPTWPNCGDNRNTSECIGLVKKCVQYSFFYCSIFMLSAPSFFSPLYSSWHPLSSSCNKLFSNARGFHCFFLVPYVPLALRKQKGSCPVPLISSSSSLFNLSFILSLWLCISLTAVLPLLFLALPS